jgi:cytochrome P450
VGGYAVVTRLEDVRTVLGDAARFQVTGYKSRMRDTAADFLLGHDDRFHDEERERAGEALVPADGLYVRTVARREAADILARRAVPGVPSAHGITEPRLDVIAELIEPVHLTLVREILGVPSGSGPELLRWVQLNSWYVFNPFPRRGDRERARVAGQALRNHVERTIETRAAAIAAGAPRSTVVDAFIEFGPPRPALTGRVAGLVAGALGPGPRLCAKVIDRLLRLCGRRARELRRAAAGEDVSTVERYVLEAARFDPDPGYLYRACSGDTMLRGTEIRAGDVVVCWIEAALMDRRSISRPCCFRPARAPEEQMVFGHGLHRCLARPFGLAALTAIALELFRMQDVRPAPGRAGRLQFGAVGSHPGQNYPASLEVRFAPAPPQA